MANDWLLYIRPIIIAEINENKHWRVARRLREIALLVAPALQNIYAEVESAMTRQNDVGSASAVVKGRILLQEEISVLFIGRYKIRMDDYFASEKEEAQARTAQESAIEKHKSQMLKDFKRNDTALHAIKNNDVTAALSYYCTTSSSFRHMDYWKRRLSSLLYGNPNQIGIV
eukprot:50583-Rhodomonas_salina.1